MTQTIRRNLVLLPTVILALVALGCGDLGGVLGGDSAPPGRERTLTGEIERVDTSEREITVDTGRERLVVDYDSRLRVVDRGRDVGVESLRRGDPVRVEVSGTGRDLYTAYIEVDDAFARDRRRDPFGNAVEGEVERVDRTRRQIELDTDDGRATVRYDEDTEVFYQGGLYEPANLEPGDVVRAEIAADSSRRLTGGDRIPYTDRIEVIESVQERTRRGELDGTLSGEIEWVDTDRRELSLDTGGDRMTLRYERDTRVVYRGRQYEPANLEPGDEVRLDVERVGGELVTDFIEVTRSVSGDPEDDGPFGADDGVGDVVRLAGTVEWTDERRGELGVRTRDEGVVTVELPFDLGSTERRRFERLDRGDAVSLEAERLSRGRYELRRFR